MNTVKNGILAVLVSSFLLSGCGETGVQEYDGSENISAELYETESESITESQSDAPVEFLPPNMSMNDLLNMIQIDGKTLSMPTTLEDILALNDDFTYEMAFSEYYASPEDCIKDMGGVFYDVDYKGEKIFQTVIAKDDYTGNCMDSLIYRFSNGFGKNLIEANIDFNLTDNIDLNSTFDDVITVFGTPNDSSINTPHDLCYLFKSNDIQYKLRFCFNVDKSTDTFNELKSIQISCERE